MAIQYVDKVGDAVGTVPGPYNISASNNKLDLTIDGGSVQNFTLTNGTARTAAQIVADLSALTGATASVCTSIGNVETVRIRTTTANGASSTILVGAPANNANAALGFMATTYTGGANVSATFSTSTKANVRDNLETQLINAGWITISGSGTTNLLMQSAMTPPGQNLRTRLRIRDNGNTCLVLSLENVAGTKAHANSTNSGAQLNPGSSRNWRIIANKHQFFLFEPSSHVNRGFVGLGVPWIPNWLEGIIQECMWMNCNAASDSDTTVRGCFRSLLGTRDANGTGNQQIICNNFMLENANNTGNDNNGLINLLTLWQGTRLQRNSLTWYRWHDDAALITEPLIAFAADLNSGFEGKIRGQLWDSFITTEQYAIDATTTGLDGHNWWNIVNNQGGSTDIAHGSLFVATS